MLSSHTRAVLQAIFVTFLWSTSWVFIKIGLEEIPALTFAGLRYGLAFLLLLPLLFRGEARRSLARLSRHDWLWLVALGLVMYTLTQGAQALTKKQPCQHSYLNQHRVVNDARLHRRKAAQSNIPERKSKSGVHYCQPGHDSPAPQRQLRHSLDTNPDAKQNNGTHTHADRSNHNCRNGRRPVHESPQHRSTGIGQKTHNRDSEPDCLPLN